MRLRNLELSVKEISMDSELYMSSRSEEAFLRKKILVKLQTEESASGSVRQLTQRDWAIEILSISGLGHS